MFPKRNSLFFAGELFSFSLNRFNDVGGAIYSRFFHSREAAIAGIPTYFFHRYFCKIGYYNRPIGSILPFSSDPLQEKFSVNPASRKAPKG
jgi:hypothetical protein